MPPTETIYRYQYQSTAGLITLNPKPNGQYEVEFDGEGLGSYSNPQHAVDDVVGGHTFSPSNGVEFDELEIPKDLGDWERVVYADVKRLRRG